MQKILHYMMFFAYKQIPFNLLLFFNCKLVNSQEGFFLKLRLCNVRRPHNLKKSPTSLDGYLKRQNKRAIFKNIFGLFKKTFFNQLILGWVKQLGTRHQDKILQKLLGEAEDESNVKTCALCTCKLVTCAHAVSQASFRPSPPLCTL